MKDIKGFCYILGDNINTDEIIPSHTLTMRDSVEMAKYTLEYTDPNFTKAVKKHNIIIAGENFGSGSSREEAVQVFKTLGVKAIIAKSFARIYFRNLINLGIPAIELNFANNQFSKGDLIEIYLTKGKIINHSKNLEIEFKKLPDFLIKILKEGGIINQLKKTLAG